MSLCQNTQCRREYFYTDKDWDSETDTGDHIDPENIPLLKKYFCSGRCADIWWVNPDMTIGEVRP